MKKILLVVLTFALATSLNAKQYCHEAITNGDNVVYLSCERFGAVNYQITIESDVDINGLGGSFMHINDNQAKDLRNFLSISEDKRTATIAFESTTAPDFYTPLYILMPGEVSFGWPADIEWGKCSTDETEYTITLVQPVNGGSIAADALKATYGTVVTLTATPDEGKQLAAWDVKDAENNVISVSKTNTFTMPSSNVTVTATFKEKVDLTPATYSGKEVMEVATFNWSITRNANQTLTFMISWDKDLEGASPQICIDAIYNAMSMDGRKGSFTTTDTYEDGEKPALFFYVAYTGAAARIDVDYTVGAANTLTAVENVYDNKGSRTRKVVEDGVLYIIKDGVRYNVLGTKL